MLEQCRKQIIITIMITTRHRVRSRRDKSNTSSLELRSGSEVQLQSLDQRSRSSQRSKIKRLMQEDKQQSNLSLYSIAISFTTNPNLRFDSRMRSAVLHSPKSVVQNTLPYLQILELPLYLLCANCHFICPCAFAYGFTSSPWPVCHRTICLRLVPLLQVANLHIINS